jgi:hypothetical protein
MARHTTRTLNAFIIHGHQYAGSDEESVADYNKLFEALLKSSRTESRVNISGDTVAVTKAEKSKGQYAFRFISGNSSDSSFVYDERTGVDEEVDAGDGRYFVNGIWLFADRASRLIVIESKRPGVPRYQIEAFLSHFGRTAAGMTNLTVSLHPLPSASFYKELDAFDVIKEATLVLRRPNKSWTKTGQNLLGDLPESNAEELSISAKSSRGQSLKKDSGLVAEIKNLRSKTVNPVYNALVRGRRSGFDGERRVSLLRHLMKATVAVAPQATEDEEVDALRKGARSLNKSVREETDNDPELFEPKS